MPPTDDPITLAAPGGLSLSLSRYGARLIRLYAPDRQGALADVVLGHDDMTEYGSDHGYLGATCGRFANRIAAGRFTLDGRAVQLDCNEGGNQLHGGTRGFDKAMWEVAGQGPDQVSFRHTSPEGDMGYPGAVTVTCRYRIDGLHLWIEMTATTTAPTVVNLAHHSYWNLAGQGVGDVLGHQLQLDAAHYLPVDAAKLPTGAVLPVAGTAFDFTTRRRIGDRMPGPDGFDHCFCLKGPMEAVADQLLRPAATLLDPASGRRLRLATNQVGVQLYTGAHFDGSVPGKEGTRYGRFAGVALETQAFPDSPNRPQFPATRLNPGEVYRHVMLLDFTPS
ncbi:MAG: hypothetical protein B7Z31_03845 [Rhodobacterales bacterium 12-65-15]|nr:MAG: hypothetical protein B7Z31_03845 [Rhodobacterales bacterium 12-65-15]